MPKGRQKKEVDADPVKEEIQEVVHVKNAAPRWVKVTIEQLKKVQNEGRLCGWNPETSEALIKD